jgi:hypothetical protein
MVQRFRGSEFKGSGFQKSINKDDFSCSASQKRLVEKLRNLKTLNSYS